MTLEEFKSEYPDIAKALIAEGESAADDKVAGIQSAVDGQVSEARQAGIDAERARVVSILEADADREVTMTAISDGTSAEGFYKLAFAAEKQKRAAGLESMRAQATPPVEVTAPAEPQGVKPPDQELAEKAKKVMAEDGIDFAAASARVLAADKDLAARYRALYA